MAKSRNLTQYESDAKNGKKMKGFKLKIEDITFFEEVATKYGFNHNELLVKAVQFFDEHNKPTQ